MSIIEDLRKLLQAWQHMSMCYILDRDGNPQLEPDLVKWAMWFEDYRNRIVQQDWIGSVRVSTVFLALDHSFAAPAKKPMLWETKIFGGEHDQWMNRYTSRQDAIAGHNRALEMVKAAQSDLQELERMAETGGWTKQ